MNLKIDSLTLSNGTTAYVLRVDPGSHSELDGTAVLTADLIFKGNRTTVQNNVRELNRLIERAAKAQVDGTLAKGYIEIDPGSGYVRSEIVGGFAEASNDYYDRLSRNDVPVRLVIQRKNWWEGAETQVALTNINGSNNTTGLKVYNANDFVGTAPNRRCNYVDISQYGITGNLPAACRLEMVSNYAASRISDVHLGHYIKRLPYVFSQNIEFESDPSNYVYAPKTASAAASGGQYLNANITNDAAQLLGNFTLDSTKLSALAGGHYRVMARTLSNTFSGDIRLHAAVYFPSGPPITLMQRTPDVLTKSWSSEIIDLGMLQLPPWLPGVAPLGAVGLTVWGRRTGGFNIQLDNLFLMPNYRLLRPRGYGFAESVLLADDGLTDTVWTQWGTDKSGYYAGYGDRIMLVPGVDQTIYFATSSWTGDAAIDQAMTVKLFYRPRRLEA